MRPLQGGSATDSSPVVMQGPYFLTATLPAPFPFLVTAHCKQDDDHVTTFRPQQVDRPEGEWCSVDFGLDALQLRLPLAPGGDRNFVVGLDVCVTHGVRCVHPTDSGVAPVDVRPLTSRPDAV